MGLLLNHDFLNAQEAFEKMYLYLETFGHLENGTKSLYNAGFYIRNPQDRMINTEFRQWSINYALREWSWYLSQNPSAEQISKHAPIWKNHMDSEGNVRSNYGWQWNRNDALKKVIKMLSDCPATRRAVLSIYDSKEIDTYAFDTPCTNSIHFQIIDNKLCMTVNMRSNDIWYGFCNDQYCFSRLQELVASDLRIDIGWYYHFASNLHLYEEHYGKQNN